MSACIMNKLMGPPEKYWQRIPSHTMSLSISLGKDIYVSECQNLFTDNSCKKIIYKRANGKKKKKKREAQSGWFFNPPGTTSSLKSIAVASFPPS